MTPENQRIAIAKACGYFDIVRKHSLYFGLFGKIMPKRQPGPGAAVIPEAVERNIPDYLGSLDVMHEVEKVLTRDQRQEYVNLLWPNGYSVQDAIMAPASQRAEAFLKTLGLWTED